MTAAISGPFQYGSIHLSRWSSQVGFACTSTCGVRAGPAATAFKNAIKNAINTSRRSSPQDSANSKGRNFTQSASDESSISLRSRWSRASRTPRGPVQPARCPARGRWRWCAGAGTGWACRWRGVDRSPLRALPGLLFVAGGEAAQLRLADDPRGGAPGVVERGVLDAVEAQTPVHSIGVGDEGPHQLGRGLRRERRFHHHGLHQAANLQRALRRGEE